MVEGGLTSRVVVGFPERLRAHRDDLEALPVTTPGGAVVRLGEVARARFDLGPGLVPRENVQRLAMITANVALPLAMVGGMLAVAVGGAGLSVASLVGIITLFGIATRNGVLLVTHYEHVMREEGLPLCEAVACGSRERLAPLLMTALTAGLALIPLVLAGEKPGNEIQSPMAEVILGGLLSSTFLNLVVVPVLFARWGKDPTHEQLEPGAKA